MRQRSRHPDCGSLNTMSTLLLHSVSYAGLWGQAFLPVDEFVAKAA